MSEISPRRRGRGHGRSGPIIGLACALALTLVATVTGTAQAATGMSYQQNWSNGQGRVNFSPNMGNGTYSINWSGVGDFVSGIGWKPGNKNRTITYSSSLQANGGTALMTLYGWSQNPLIEYYVIDNWGGAGPNRAGQNMGTVTSDGGTYTIIKHQQVNQPSIVGNTTFWQYLAIRQSPRTSGTITVSNFVNAWASKGMNLGSMDYQIMATEGWGGGSGSATMNVTSG